jgi:hypothetical protein
MTQSSASPIFLSPEKDWTGNRGSVWKRDLNALSHIFAARCNCQESSWILKSLVARSGELRGFAITGTNRKFVWADAVIRGNTVVVWSESAPRPVAVRYAWSKNPKATLFNRAGLPASGFRTDKWPGITERSGAMGGVDNV